MAASPEEKESTTISMVVDEWSENQVEQFSPVCRINGFPCLVCDKSQESELWECTAIILVDVTWNLHKNRAYKYTTCHKFTSWDKGSQDKLLFSGQLLDGSQIELEIMTNNQGEICTVRPSLHPFDPRDGILVFGKEKKKIQVNKKSLASQSPFFDRLFSGDFKEKNMPEIPIAGVEYEEFVNMMAIIYGLDDASLTNMNACDYLRLADRFEIKNRLLPQYTTELAKELSESPEWQQLSRETLRRVVRSL